MITSNVLFGLWIISAVFCGPFGYYLGEKGYRGNGPEGILFGLLFGPLGLLIAAVMPADKKSPAAKAREDDAARLTRIEKHLERMSGKSATTAAVGSSKPLMRASESDADSEIPAYKL